MWTSTYFQWLQRFRLSVLKVAKEYSFLRDYDNDWPIRDIIISRLKYTSESARRKELKRRRSRWKKLLWHAPAAAMIIMNRIVVEPRGIEILQIGRTILMINYMNKRTWWEITKKNILSEMIRNSNIKGSKDPRRVVLSWKGWEVYWDDRYTATGSRTCFPRYLELDDER